MSIMYKLFGVPRNFDEFVDKVKKKGNDKVDIVIDTFEFCVSDAPSVADAYYSLLSLKSGKIKFKLNKMSSSKPRFRNLGLAELELESLNKSIDLAEKLMGFGLEATINGEFVDDARLNIPKYESNIEKIKKEQNYS
jgi:hypothetical protein